jgi:hypothetical protein
MGKMFETVINGVNYLRGNVLGGRSYTVFPDDTLIVSYPRSGNTWTRFLIANLVWQEAPITFANIESKIPDVYTNTRKRLAKISRPRILKTHAYLDVRYQRVIYIVRDPRDVVVSCYHFHRKMVHLKHFIPDDYPLTAYVNRLIEGEFFDCGSWRENVAGWIAARFGTPGFLLLRYEDMKRQTEVELAKVARFLGVEATPERLARAVELSSAERMRGLEKTEGKVWASTKHSRNDIPFIRNAVAGGWRRDLPIEIVAQIEAAWGPWMETLGYSLVTEEGRSASSSSFLMGPLFSSTVGSSL